jgi:hypothetical protein
MLHHSLVSGGHELAHSLTSLNPQPPMNPQPAIAGTPVPTPIPVDPNNGFQNLENFASNIQAFLRVFGVSVFICGISFGGILRMVAVGDENKIRISNQALLAAVAGLILILLAPGIANALTGSFSAP